ncbi:MAG: hypothetical protein V1809_12900 [Planctomycetota bacterium]
MPLAYRIHTAPSDAALRQGARIGSNMAIVYSVGPCGALRFDRDPASGRVTDEFPIYFPDYPKVGIPRRRDDAAWIEPFRARLRKRCDLAESLGVTPVFHLYEPMLPLAFEAEYPDLVKVWQRPTQEGAKPFHTLLDPDREETWALIRAKYRELARDFPKVGMYVITTGDTASAFWCVPKARMPVADRLARMAREAREGIREAGSRAVVCVRLWWRNFPDELYRDGHRLIGEVTGLGDAAGDLMSPIGRPHNDPSVVLPRLFEQLPPDVPVMYKSTRMDYHENTPLSHALGRYPRDRAQILEISYEVAHETPFRWCKVRHIRKGLDAVREHNLAGYMSLAINMGNNTETEDPESGGLGRMNTWLFEQLAKGDMRDDGALVATWLEREFGAPAPAVVVAALLDAEELVNDGLHWGRGIRNRVPFASPHTTRLYWMFDGFIQPDFPYKMANPDRDTLESLIRTKEAAHERVRGYLAKFDAARDAIPPKLFAEIREDFQTLADVILLQKDWGAYILTLYGIEKGVFPADRPTLGRMSRHAETFIRNLLRLADTPAGRMAREEIAFPDNFPLT